MVPEAIISTPILLAEDDNDMRRFLVKALENAGYRGLVLRQRPVRL